MYAVLTRIALVGKRCLLIKKHKELFSLIFYIYFIFHIYLCNVYMNSVPPFLKLHRTQ